MVALIQSYHVGCDNMKKKPLRSQIQDWFWWSCSPVLRKKGLNEDRKHENKYILIFKEIIVSSSRAPTSLAGSNLWRLCPSRTTTYYHCSIFIRFFRAKKAKLYYIRYIKRHTFACNSVYDQKVWIIWRANRSGKHNPKKRQDKFAERNDSSENCHPDSKIYIVHRKDIGEKFRRKVEQKSRSIGSRRFSIFFSFLSYPSSWYHHPHSKSEDNWPFDCWYSFWKRCHLFPRLPLISLFVRRASFLTHWTYLLRVFYLEIVIPLILQFKCLGRLALFLQQNI